MQTKSLNLLDILKHKSVARRIQLEELESATTHNQLQDVVSLKLYPATGTRVSRGMESAVTRIHGPELESTRGQFRKTHRFPLI